MNKATTKLFLLITLLIASFTACKESNSIFNSDFEDDAAPDPVINSITPEGSYLAGVDSIIINGENFSTEENGNQIFFNGQAGIVHSATETQLVVRPAQVISDSVIVQAASRGALNFSNQVMYDLDQPTFLIPGYTDIHLVNAVTKNAVGDIIFDLVLDGSPEGIKIWRTTGEVEDYLSTTFSWNSLKVGPDGLVYALRSDAVRALYREDEGGLTAFTFSNITTESFRNMDFGPDNFLWIVGNNNDVIRVDISDGTLSRYPFTANLRAVRYYNSKLYIGGADTDGIERVWSFDVIDNNLTNLQQVLNFSEAAPNNSIILEVTFDAEGMMYLGSNTGTGIYTWTSELGLKKLFEGWINPSGMSMTWVGEHLVASVNHQGRASRHIAKIDRRREGAPYLGTD